MVKKQVTIDDLARMVAKGFEDTAKKEEVDARFDSIDEQFTAVNTRLDRIEKLILADHKRRIEKLEEGLQELRELLAVK